MSIAPKKKFCSGCGDEKIIWKNHKGEKYCKDCWARIKLSEDTLKPINAKSKKQSQLDILYSQLRIPFLNKYPMCQAALHGCTGSSTDVHHKKGRGKYLLDTSTWMSVCRQCHHWIETHPIEATEMGFRESKIV